MGRRSRERHGRNPVRQGAARSDGEKSFDWRSGELPPPTEVLVSALRKAALDHLAGDAHAAADCAVGLLERHFDNQTVAVDTAVDTALRRAVRRLWECGWLPHDAVQVTRRQSGELGAALVTDVIAAEVERYPAITVHQRWRAQLETIDAVIWWDHEQPHLGQWISRNRSDRDEALTLVVTVLALIISLPALLRILPPPGTVGAGISTDHAGVDQRVLARVRGLLAKAESTEFPDEADALSAKAQDLMNRHALERAVVDAEHHVTQSATSRRIWLDNPYLTAKTTLVDVVATANRCRAVFHEQFGFVTLVGEELDLQIAELLATSLLVQGTKAMLSAGSRASRTFRQSFLVAYAVRVGERLGEVTAASSVTSDLAADARLLPVLADRKRAVDDLFEEMFTKTVAKSLTIKDLAGWGAGRAAADCANLGVEHPALPTNAGR